jgi:chemotaxis protein CheD
MNAMSAMNPAAVARITVMQGKVHASGDPQLEMGTVLGSCVACCLFDPDARIGGMNHFLLAEPPASHAAGKIDEHYGVYLMELLINEMLALGASTQRLRAHLYGGANMRAGMAPIGADNAAFAQAFLIRERIPLMRHDLGGHCARRVDFRPATGQVRCRIVANTLAPDVKPTRRAERSDGDVELF